MVNIWEYMGVSIVMGIALVILATPLKMEEIWEFYGMIDLIIDGCLMMMGVSMNGDIPKWMVYKGKYGYSPMKFGEVPEKGVPANRAF